MGFTIQNAAAAASKINVLKMKLNPQNVKSRSCRKVWPVWPLSTVGVMA